MTSSPTVKSDEIPLFQELLRKLVHMGSLLIPASYYLLDLSKGQMLAIMIPAWLVVTMVDLARLGDWRIWRSIFRPIFGGMIRRHESTGDFTGAFYILLSTCAMVAFFDKPIAVAALAFIIVGDTFAAIIGRTLGGFKIGRKSVEGSLGCLAGTLLVAWFTPDLPLSVGVLGAVTATVVEALSFDIDDNISVPIVSGLVMTIVLKIVTFG